LRRVLRLLPVFGASAFALFGARCAVVFSQVSGGRPWAIIVAGAVCFLALLLLVILVMYPWRRD
jgi:hypothetical protein